MNREVLTLSPELPIGEAVTLLVRRGFSGAPVVERDGRLVGVLSEIDCLRVLSAAAFHVMPTGTVGDHMTGAVQSVGPEVDLLQVASTLEQNHFRRLPVVAAGRFVGLITRRDVLRALDALRAEQAKAVQRPRTRYEDIESRRPVP